MSHEPHTQPDRPANTAAGCPFVGHGSAVAVVVTPSASRPVRWLYLVVGLVCFGLAIAGAVLPGLPTTIFVLGGSYCLTRSCPWIERRLMSTRLLSPYAKYLDPTTPFPRRARIMAAAAMWASIAVSISILVVTERGPVWLLGVIVAAGLVGTVCIANFRRKVAAAG